LHENTAHGGAGVLLALFLIFLFAQIGAEISQRLKLPAVVGEIAAGIVIGPSLLGWVTPSSVLDVLAEIGAVLLLFSVGLETRLGDLQKIGKMAGLVAGAGVALPFVLGYTWGVLSGFSPPHAAFIAAAFTATSAGITARVLQELGVLGRIESRIILGAAVLDDILAMLILGVVTALQVGGNKGVDWAHLGFVLLQAVGFVVTVALVGTRIIRKRSSVLDAPINPLSALTMSLAGCLGLAALSARIGLAAIIGAFLAGIVVAESKQRHALEKQMQPLLAFLTPFFFVVTGMNVSLSALSGWKTLLSLAVITLLATAGKWIGCGLASLSLGKRSAAIIGVGMVPRGEVGIIVASLGRGAGIFNDTIYALIVAMSLLTSIIAPPILTRLLKDAPPPTGGEAVKPDDEDVPHLYSVEETGHSAAA
jgi:Kef-type K+ transport system membrane component KefB